MRAFAYESGKIGKEGSTITGLIGQQGECVDAHGDIFVTTYYGLLEFAYGGTTPIRTIAPTFGDERACSVDDRRGSLAIVSTNPHDPGGVRIRLSVRVRFSHAIRR